MGALDRYESQPGHPQAEAVEPLCSEPRAAAHRGQTPWLSAAVLAELWPKLSQGDCRAQGPRRARSPAVLQPRPQGTNTASLLTHGRRGLASWGSGCKTHISCHTQGPGRVRATPPPFLGPVIPGTQVPPHSLSPFQSAPGRPELAPKLQASAPGARSHPGRAQPPPRCSIPLKEMQGLGHRSRQRDAAPGPPARSPSTAPSGAVHAVGPTGASSLLVSE